MDIEKFSERFKETAEEVGFTAETTDEELVKLYISHKIMLEWQTDEYEKAAKREARKEAERRERIRQITSVHRY